MTKIFLSVYYSLILYIITTNGYYFMTSNSNNAEFVMLAKPFSFLLGFPLSYFIVLILALTLAFIAILKPSRLIFVLVSFFLILLYSIKFSNGKINHSEHIWLISSIFACFMSHPKKLSDKQNLICLRLMQASLLSIYFIAGLWKIREANFSKWMETPLEHIAYAVAEGHGSSEFITQLLLVNYPWLISVGFTCVLIFQLSTVIPLILNKYFKAWGVLAVLFHISTGVALNIWFSNTILAAVFLLVISEDLLKSESRKQE